EDLKAEPAVYLHSPTINISKTPAGEVDVDFSPPPVQRIEPQQVDVAGSRRAAPHCLEQAIRHPCSEPAHVLLGEEGTRLEIKSDCRAEAAGGIFCPHDPAFLAENDEPGADVERGDIDDLAVGANGNLGGAAADIDVHHRRAVTDRTRHRARSVS